MTLRSRALLAVPVLALGTLVAACDTGSDRGQSIYTPDETAGQRLPDPTLTSVAPKTGEPTISGKAVAGFTPLTITGTGFVQGKTYVYFNGTRVPIVSLTSTQIEVQAPNMPVDNINVKVSVVGAVNFSSVKQISLATALVRWGKFLPTNAGYGVATNYGNNSGYVSATENNASQGIQYVSGETRENSIATGNFTWPELTYLDGFVYGVRGVRAVFRFTPGSSTQTVWTNTSDFGSTVLLNAIDIESDGTVWTGGTLSATGTAADRMLYRVAPGAAPRATTKYPHGGVITAIEATPSAIYVAGTVGTTTGVWKYTRSGTTLGAPTLLASVESTLTINAMAAASDGSLLLGVAPTDVTLNATFTDPLLRVLPDGTVNARLGGLLTKGIVAMRWLDADHLLVTGAAIVGNADSQKPTAGDLLVVAPLVSAQP